MKTTTIAALFVASVLLIGVTAVASPAYAGIETSPIIETSSGSLSFLDILLSVIQGSGWGWL